MECVAHVACSVADDVLCSESKWLLTLSGVFNVPDQLCFYYFFLLYKCLFVLILAH